MPKCTQCGKVLKNAFAMKIHAGRMHKKGKAPKARKAVKPVAGLDITALGVHALIDVKKWVDGRLANMADQLRAAGVMDQKPGRKPGKMVAAVMQVVAPKAKKKPKKRGHFKETAAQFILGQVKGMGATTAQINKAWKAAGRGATASPNLSTLFKAKKLKREPLKGEKGFLYSLA